jgi:hypothetical protein
MVPEVEMTIVANEYAWVIEYSIGPQKPEIPVSTDFESVPSPNVWEVAAAATA